MSEHTTAARPATLPDYSFKASIDISSARGADGTLQSIRPSGSSETQQWLLVRLEVVSLSNGDTTVAVLATPTGSGVLPHWTRSDTDPSARLPCGERDLEEQWFKLSAIQASGKSVTVKEYLTRLSSDEYSLLMKGNMISNTQGSLCLQLYEK